MPVIWSEKSSLPREKRVNDSVYADQFRAYFVEPRAPWPAKKDMWREAALKHHNWSVDVAGFPA